MLGAFTVFAAGCSKESDNPEKGGADIILSDNVFDSLDINTRLVLPEPEDEANFIKNDANDKMEASQETVNFSEISVFENDDAPNETGVNFAHTRPIINEDDYFVVGEDTTPTMVYGFN